MFTSAASHAPVPEAGNIITSDCVLKIVFMPLRHLRANAANSGPRWSIVGLSIALSTLSGTLVGPGIWRK